MHDVRLEKFTKWNLDMPTLKSTSPADLHCSFRQTVETRFGLLETVPHQANKCALTLRKLACSILHWWLGLLQTVPQQATTLSTRKAGVFNSALALAGLGFTFTLALAGLEFGVAQTEPTPF
jgi:hypothetical protein